MPQWGNTDDAANSVLWATTAVNLTPNTTNQTALFGNTTVNAFNNNGVAMKKAVGQFGLDVTEMNLAQSNASVAQYIITNAGSGYAANASVTVANTSGGANTQLANSTVATGRVTAVTANVTVGGYTSAPTVTIAAPAAIIFNGNTAVSGNTIALTTANSKFLVGDKVVYAGNTLSTPGGLTDTATYYISFSNTTVVALSATPGGANIALTKAAGDNTTAGGATLTGETATAVAVLSGVNHGAAHTGWVLRTVGTGGRAGRVQYETLVAMGGNLSTDAEDVVLKDA